MAGKPKAGWYPHPTMADTRRYWDGEKWTSHIAPGAARANSQRDGNTDTLLAAGWIFAFLLPIVGFIIGCVALTRRAGQGVAIMVVAVTCGIAWWFFTVALVTSDDALDCGTENAQRSIEGLPSLPCP